MSSINIDGTIHDIPGVVVEATIPDEQLVADAIQAREQAEATEEEASPNRWHEADNYAELLRRPGWTQQRVADTCGVSQSTVSKFAACARHYSVLNNRPKFWTAFQERNSEGARVGNSADDDDGDHDEERLPDTEWTDDERTLKEQLQEGDTIVVNLRTHSQLILWAKDNGRYERVDRKTDWGNPFEMPADGDRHTVIRNYDEHYLPHKPSLLNRLGLLQGKALGCWCAPEPCHGDVLKREADGEVQFQEWEDG